MRVAFLVLLAALELGGGFGAASATVESVSTTSMTVDLQVEVKTTASAVVAHLAFDDDPQISLPLLDRDGGVFGIRTELPVKDYVVVFEALGSDESLSSPALLSALGADFGDADVATPSTVPSAGDDGLSSQTKQLGWLALALGAASLSVLAFWVIIGRDGRSGSADGDTLEEE